MDEPIRIQHTEWEQEQKDDRIVIRDVRSWDRATFGFGEAIEVVRLDPIPPGEPTFEIRRGALLGVFTLAEAQALHRRLGQALSDKRA